MPKQVQIWPFFDEQGIFRDFLHEKNACNPGVNCVYSYYEGGEKCHV